MSDDIIKEIQGVEGIQEYVDIVKGTDENPFNPVLGDFKEQVDKIVEILNLGEKLKETPIKDYLLILLHKNFAFDNEFLISNLDCRIKKGIKEYPKICNDFISKVIYINNNYEKIKNPKIKEIIFNMIKDGGDTSIIFHLSRNMEFLLNDLEEGNIDTKIMKKLENGEIDFRNLKTILEGKKQLDENLKFIFITDGVKEKMLDLLLENSLDYVHFEIEQIRKINSFIEKIGDKASEGVIKSISILLEKNAPSDVLGLLKKLDSLEINLEDKYKIEFLKAFVK